MLNSLINHNHTAILTDIQNVNVQIEDTRGNIRGIYGLCVTCFLHLNVNKCVCVCTCVATLCLRLYVLAYFIFLYSSTVLDFYSSFFLLSVFVYFQCSCIYLYVFVCYCKYLCVCGNEWTHKKSAELREDQRKERWTGRIKSRGSEKRLV